jgi:hypothetical protein
MPKYLLLKHYRGGPEPHHPFPPMDQWAPEDVEAHMAFQRHVSELLQEALLEALRVWPEHPPRDPRAWLTTVATRRLVDARRSEAARQRREETEYAEPRPVATEEGDDTLFLLFSCCHPDLAPASQVALTLRAVGDLAVVLRVLYLVYTAGHAGRVDLAGEAIRLARQLTHRWHAVRGHLHELGGDRPAAATAYAEAARRTTNVAERDHLVRQAARARVGGDLWGVIARERIGQRGARGDPELAVDAGQVSLDRSRRDVQRLGDVAVGVPGRGEIGNPPLTRGQRLGSAQRFSTRAAARGVQLRLRTLGQRLSAAAIRELKTAP